jgi:3-isopropylmalate dehydrogenase
LNAPEAATANEHAVAAVLDDGLRTGDIANGGETIVGTTAMGDAVVAALDTRA